jgi:hypothetical protein
MDLSGPSIDVKLKERKKERQEENLAHVVNRLIEKSSTTILF